MSAILKVQPLKNVVLSEDDARDYEVLVIVEPGWSWGLFDLTMAGWRQQKEIVKTIEEEFENECRIIDLVVVFGVRSDEEAESLFAPTVRDCASSWVAIGNDASSEFAQPALKWTLRGLTAEMGRVPSVAVMGGVLVSAPSAAPMALEDSVLSVANVIAETFPESVITVLLSLCLTEADYALDAPPNVAYDARRLSFHCPNLEC